jgi:hypothetical protein
MDPDKKVLWVEALRSGKFRQGFGRLAGKFLFTGEVEYCCLGVLSELAFRASAVSRETTGASFYRYGKYLTGGILAPEVSQWAGFSTHDPDYGDPRVKVTDGSTRLSRVNDDLRYNFDQIADLIEAQF